MTPEERQAEFDRLSSIVSGADALRSTLETVDAEYSAAMDNAFALHKKRADTIAGLAAAEKAKDQLVALKADGCGSRPQTT